MRTDDSDSMAWVTGHDIRQVGIFYLFLNLLNKVF